MILIAHRGNTTGRNAEKENDPDQIELVISQGYEVEVDVRLIKGQMYLGHDGPERPITASWLDSIKERAWIHCKNLGALSHLNGSDFNYFWHDTDDYTITSKGHIWVYPGKPFNEQCVVVMPEAWSEGEALDCRGVCSDNISAFRRPS